MHQTPESSSSKRKKRLRDDDEEEEEEEEEEEKAETSDGDQTLSLEESLTFSDTLVALRIMRAQFPQIDKVSIQPFILRSQLYSSVKDRTQVDRELESLRREKLLRIFKLNTGQDDHAIMFLDDYLCQVDLVVKRLEEKKQGDVIVFEWFRTHVIDVKLEASIDHQELTRQLIDPNMYWFAIPNIGSVLKGLSQGRKELLSLISSRRYKEMMLAPLEKKRLRFSPLDMRFHLRDLFGSGHLKTVSNESEERIRQSNESEERIRQSHILPLENSR
ncbi:serine/threonine-protein kinase 19 isoform X4 [Ricinus communis]|uniref:serine/threonine-protein kinase 19 isoform X4 n=1 Tax=Ricinus communis TaxID=3988 RepID=UPI00201A6F62|nr:serine/threonine-protein kinase 19 isoform X4 [Ricinus communis]